MSYCVPSEGYHKEWWAPLDYSFSWTSVMSLSEFCIYSPFCFGEGKKKSKQQKGCLEELNIVRCWFSHSKISLVVTVCPDEQMFPGQRRSAVDARQKIVNCSKMWENFRLQVSATFCILQVLYGRSMHKTVLWHLPKMYFTELLTVSDSTYCWVCLQMIKLYSKCHLTLKIGFSCLVRVSTCVYGPNPPTTDQSVI